MKFEDVIAEYQRMSALAVETKYDADVAYAKALLAADGKSEGIRKAQADIAAADELRRAALAASEASVLRHIVVHLRGDHGAADREGA